MKRKRLIRNAKSASEVTALQSEFTKYDGPGAEAARERIMSLGLQEYQKVVDVVVPLLKRVKAKLEEEKAKSTADEAALFARHGLAHEGTACSRRYDPLISHMRDYIEGLVNPPPQIVRSLPPPVHPVLSWLTE